MISCSECDSWLTFIDEKSTHDNVWDLVHLSDKLIGQKMVYKIRRN